MFIMGMEHKIYFMKIIVFYFSVHQHPFYPKAGRPSETGNGEGKGFTLNVELPKVQGIMNY